MKFRSHHTTTTDRIAIGASALTVFAAIGLICAGVAGWVLNLIALVGMLDGGITAMFVARLVGVFVAPLGSILGLFF
jgi:hypothetical protein